MKNDGCIFYLLITVFFLCPLLQAESLKIEAEKMIYLKQGDIVKFKKNVTFSKEGFKGNSKSLLLDKKTRVLSASGNVYIILKSTTARMLKLWTKKILYNEETDKISSTSPSKFLVFTSTRPKSDAVNTAEVRLTKNSESPVDSGVYEITCDSFYGFVAKKRFYLSGKPVIINGDDHKSKADFVDFSNDVITMRENASMDYKGEKPYLVNAELIRIDTVSGKINFKKNVEGTFYDSGPQ